MAYKFENIKVLLVEDNQAMLQLTKAVLTTFGIKNIITASNGEVAFERFRAEKADLIVADWMMKPVDGISLTHMVRSHSASPDPYVPIILVTGFSEKRRVFEARDAGVTEFLVKPFNARDLYRRIARIIESPRQFVRSEDFFGPDRRRKTDAVYDGDKKRQEDSETTTVYI